MIYKYSLFLLFCLLALYNPGYAQEASPKLGVKGGVTHMTNGGADSGNWGHRTGFAVGGSIWIDAPAALAFRSEALYVQKGAMVRDNNLTVRREFDYLQFPILVELELPLSKRTSFTTFTGPVVGFNIGSNQTVSGPGQENIYAFNGSLRTTEVGATIGIGMYLQLGTGHLGVDVRYELGLNSIEEYSGDFVRNQGTMVMTSFAF